MAKAHTHTVLREWEEPKVCLGPQYTCVSGSGLKSDIRHCTFNILISGNYCVSASYFVLVMWLYCYTLFNMTFNCCCNQLIHSLLYSRLWLCNVAVTNPPLQLTKTGDNQLHNTSSPGSPNVSFSEVSNLKGGTDLRTTASHMVGCCKPSSIN